MIVPIKLIIIALNFIVAYLNYIVYEKSDEFRDLLASIAWIAAGIGWMAGLVPDLYGG